MKSKGFWSYVLVAFLFGMWVGLFILKVSDVVGQEYPHAQYDLILPADEYTWNSCCHDQDCMQARDHIYTTPPDKEDIVTVQIDFFPPFKVQAKKVFHSQNGKAYFCTYNRELPPSTTNTLCVFITGGNV